MEDGVALARDQCVHAHAGLFRNFGEAPAFDFVSRERFPLLIGKLVERVFQLFPHQRAKEGSLRPAVGRRKQFLNLQAVRILVELFRAFLPEEIDDTVASHPVQPCAHLFDGLHQPVRLHQLGEDILQNILRVALIEDAVADELAQTPLLEPEDPGQPVVAESATQCVLHLLRKAYREGKYFKRRWKGSCAWTARIPPRTRNRPRRPAPRLRWEPPKTAITG